MKCHITTRNQCRLCGSGRLHEVVRFAGMPLTDELISAERLGQEFRADLAVYWCADCHAAQTQHDVEVQDYYRDYQYTVSGSAFARRYMQLLAETVFKWWNLPTGTRVLEIGSGDGYQLSCFQRLGAQVLGFEPSAELTRMALASGVPTEQTLFDCQGAEQIPSSMRPANVILLTYTFDHLPDPRAFLKLVKDVLEPDRGLLIIEIHDFEKIVERREICLFEHEHSIYLTRLTLRRFFEAEGWKVVTDDLLPANERRGNSLLFAAAPSSSCHSTEPFEPSDVVKSLEGWPRLHQFSEDVASGIRRFRDFVGQRTSDGQIVCGYGAGGRGVITLAMTGTMVPAVQFLCDQNPAVHGFYTPVTHVPVVPPEYADEHPADVMVVFSYSYMNEIRQRMGKFQQRGGALVSMLDIM
jgi:SAM-dependent methyltransferase